MGASDAKERARRCAQRQAGRITYAQLLAAGLTRRVIATWIENGELTRTRPRVYALGPPRTDLAARLWEAVLYAGPGAYLTGASAAHYLGLINFPPATVIVATPRRSKSLPGITVLRQRRAERALAFGLPVAPLTEIMLDLAAREGFNVVRHAIEVLDYRRILDVPALLEACEHGRPGSAKLRRALNQRLPGLNRCKSPLEIAFLLLCEAYRLPLPKVNFSVHGIEADMWWPELGLVVELDGGGNHGTAAQQRNDAEKMATLRGHGLTVIRLDWWDVHEREAATLARLAELGVSRGADRTTTR
jgi:hypothetical protein